MKEETAGRLGRLREAMTRLGLDAVLAESPPNRRYLSGFTGSAGWLLVTQDEAILVTDFRYVEQAEQEAPGIRVQQYDLGRLSGALGELFKKTGSRRVGFEQDFTTFRQYTLYREALPELDLVPASEVLNGLRLIKEPREQEAILEAMKVSEAALGQVLPLVKPGVAEQELATELEFRMKRLGAEGLAFEPIVASGERSSLPHARPTSRKLKVGDLIIFDLGAVYNGYSSDITRTVVLGQPSPEQRRIYLLVLRAQRESLEFLRSGRLNREVDAVARGIITRAGYESTFGHGLGHGVGLEVHEAPRLGPQADEIALAAGMVLTVEPGIYLPGWGGVRIEDTVVVMDEGARVLSTFSKELMVL